MGTNRVTPVTLPPGRFQARDQAAFYNVLADHEDNRNGGGRLHRRPGNDISAQCDDHGHVMASQLVGKRRQLFEMSFGPTVFDSDILALDIARVS